MQVRLPHIKSPSPPISKAKANRSPELLNSRNNSIQLVISHANRGSKELIQGPQSQLVQQLRKVQAQQEKIYKQLF